MTTFRSKPRFLCDVDDVLAAYVDSFCSAVLATHVRTPEQVKSTVFDQWDLSKCFGLSEEEDNKVYSLVNMPGFASMLPALPGAVDGVKKIMTIADVFFVTSPLKSSPTWSYDRRIWLEREFGEDVKVIITAEKYTVDGDFLLDDKPEHCSEWMIEHPLGMPLLWATGRNTDQVPAGVPLVGNWPLVYELVKVRAGAMARAR